MSKRTWKIEKNCARIGIEVMEKTADTFAGRSLNLQGAL